MQDINNQIQELNKFFEFVDTRDKQLWDKYLRVYEANTKVLERQ